MRTKFWRDGPRIPSIVLFGLVALSIFGGIFAIVQNLAAEREERAQVALTTEIVTALRDSSRALIDAETGQRGFVLTGDARYLAPYLEGSREWPSAQARLENSIERVATARQAEAVEQLRILGERKLVELARTVSLMENGYRDEALEVVNEGSGQRTMQQYRGLIAELEDYENSALDDAVNRARISETRFVPILGGLSLVLLFALALGLWQMVRTAKAEAEASTARSLAEARDRADLLSRELNHRVKNLFAVIQSIVRMSLRGESDMATASRKISERINALSVAHSVTQGQLEATVASLEDLVRTAIAPYVNEERPLTVEGPAVEIVAKQITPLGMILHELVTNCVKYGAWSQDDGSLTVRWRVDPGNSDMIDFDWIENAPGTIEPEGESGFGTRLITASAQQLDGTIERTFRPEGLQVDLTFART